MTDRTSCFILAGNTGEHNESHLDTMLQGTLALMIIAFGISQSLSLRGPPGHFSNTTPSDDNHLELNVIRVYVWF